MRSLSIPYSSVLPLLTHTITVYVLRRRCLLAQVKSLFLDRFVSGNLSLRTGRSLDYADPGQSGKIRSILEAVYDGVACRGIRVSTERDKANFLLLELRPIGFLHTPLLVKKGTPPVKIDLHLTAQ